MRKVMIFDHGGGELANQLWNYASIYAFCLEHRLMLENPSFYEYGRYFSFEASRNPFFRHIFFAPFKNDMRRKQSFKKRTWRKVYKLYSIFIQLFHKRSVINSLNYQNNPLYLSPTVPLPHNYKSKQNLYLKGWLFRNPVGLEKYSREIKEYFVPQEYIQEYVGTTLGELRKKYSHVVGVHIRQGDYKTWREGKYFIDQKRVREILDEYLFHFHKYVTSTYFLITTDGPIDDECFKGLNYLVNNKDMVTDLFTLAGCDVVIGSDSSFGDFAAYYGNIPHIVLKNEPIDWPYYLDKKGFFANKYCTMVHY